MAFLLSFLAGIACANFGEFAFSELGLIASLGIFLSLLSYPKSKLIFCLGLMLLGLSLGIGRFELTEHVSSSATLDYWNDQATTLTFQGYVSAEPDQRLTHTKLTLTVTEIFLAGELAPIHGKVLLKAPLLPRYAYGDYLQVTGKLETPFQGPEFNYQQYLALQEIYSVSYYPQIKKLGEDQGNFLLAQIFRLKQKVLTLAQKIFLTEPQTNLLVGLLLGLRTGLPEDVLANFEITGLTHIVAISGYNISLIIIFVTAILGAFIPRSLQLPLAFLIIVIFTILVGASAGVIRAAIMGLLGFLALTLGRPYHLSLSLVLTAFVMTVFNPKILLQDISFQLSFAAVLGLIFVAPLVEKLLLKIPDILAIRTSLVLTLAAQITAVPLIVFYFERLSLAAPLANILVAPVIPLAMFTGFLAIILGALFLPAGILLGSLTYLFLTWILGVADFLAAWPLASFLVQDFNIFLTSIYYVILILGLSWYYAKHPIKKII